MLSSTGKQSRLNHELDAKEHAAAVCFKKQTHHSISISVGVSQFPLQCAVAAEYWQLLSSSIRRVEWEKWIARTDWIKPNFSQFVLCLLCNPYNSQRYSDMARTCHYALNRRANNPRCKKPPFSRTAESWLWFLSHEVYREISYSIFQWYACHSAIRLQGID